MKELDIDQLLTAMEKPAVGNNATQIMEMLGKADDFLKQIEQLMTRLDRMGLKPLLVRGLGAKLGIDAESPLKTEYKSETHRKVFEGLNSLSEEDLKKQLGDAANVQGKEA